MAAMDGTNHSQPKLKIVEAHDTVVKRITAVWCYVLSPMILADALQKSPLGMAHLKEAHDPLLTCS